MQMVIDIPDDVYNDMKNGKNITNIILNYTPLPKGHGRLIDADKMKNKMLYSHDISAEIEMNGTEEFINYIFNDAPTIIEAESEVLQIIDKYKAKSESE